MYWWNEWIQDPLLRATFQAVLIVLAGYAASQLIHILTFVIQRIVTSKTATDLDDRLIEVLQKHIRRIVIFVGLFVAMHRVEKVTEGQWATYLDGAFFIMMVFLVTLLLINTIRVLVEWYLISIAQRTASPVDQEVVPLVKRVGNLLLYSIAVMICLDHFHLDIKALVVSLGVGSFAIAFAAQETLANMIAGFVIMVDRPFRIGDRIRIPSTGQFGDVTKVGLRTTQILDMEHNVVIIPNSQMIKSEIINYSYPDSAMRVLIEINIAYGSDVEKAKRILETSCSSFPQILADPKPVAYLTGFADSALQMILVARASHFTDVFKTASEIRERIHIEFKQAGIEIPFPKRDVHIRTDKPVMTSGT